MRMMLILTTNAYVDREGEAISHKALQAWAARQWQGDTFVGGCPLLFWHDWRLKMGEVVYSDLVGTFLVELAREDNTPTARALWDAVERQPHGAASHGFAWKRRHLRYDKKMGKVIKVYRDLEKVETSWLPRSAAANALTYAKVVHVRREAFDKALGIEGAAALIEQELDEIIKELEKMGIEKKRLTKRNEALARLRRALKQLDEEDVERVEEAAADAAAEAVEGAVGSIDEVIAMLEAMAETLARLDAMVSALVEERAMSLEREEEEAEKARRPRLARRATQADESVVEIDVHDPNLPVGLKQFARPGAKRLFGR
jgi:tetratricopeptide (TPR) repeat protein